MSFDELEEELERELKKGMVGIDLMAVARMKGEIAFGGACSRIAVALERA